MSVLTIETMAVLTPEAVGENVISKMEKVKGAMVFDGDILTVKSPEFAPPIDISESVKSAVPSLLIL